MGKNTKIASRQAIRQIAYVAVLFVLIPLAIWCLLSDISHSVAFAFTDTYPWGPGFDSAVGETLARIAETAPWLFAAAFLFAVIRGFGAWCFSKSACLADEELQPRVRRFVSRLPSFCIPYNSAVRFCLAGKGVPLLLPTRRRTAAPTAAALAGASPLLI